jgi:glucose-6-phosphate 1-dehydrogenase
MEVLLMAEEAQVVGSLGLAPQTDAPKGNPCVMVIFGACGDVTKRLMVPAIYNLACDGLLPEEFAIVGADILDLSTDQFRARLSDEHDGIKKFHTRKQFEPKVWDWLRGRLNYVQAKDLDGYHRLADLVKKLGADYRTGGNLMFYFAVAPRFFGLISSNLYKTGFHEGEGWRRIIVEKPFGTDLKSAQVLNREILGYWREDQIYRVDHYLGKETVQNILAFRFSNGMYEPLWNKHHIDHVEFNVSESVDVEGRGGYYDQSGVLRDMMQNHMFQMLAYVCMESPASFEPDAIRNEKAKLLSAVRVYKTQEVPRHVVRGQYGPQLDDKGNIVASGYRQEKDVNPQSSTETFAAAKLLIDNWRWEGVPFYLRSGKALWKRGTEIVVQFKKAPLVIFRGTPVDHLAANRLIFHIQPQQGIEVLFHAKVPGPMLRLQTVHMKFNYGDTFRASRYTGYEVMVYSCMNGDATLFSRTDLVETAWRIAQPLLDYWQSTPATEFPNYTRGSWGPKAASELIERDGRRWYEVITPEGLARSELFRGGDELFLNAVIMALRPRVAAPGETILTKGEMGREMYLLVRGEVEVVSDAGTVVLKDGDVFGEIALLLSQPRMATVRAKTLCDLFVLEKSEFVRILRENPSFAEKVTEIAQKRFKVDVPAERLLGQG